MADPFERSIRGRSSPGVWVTITPADSDLANVLQALAWKVDGAVHVSHIDDAGATVECTVPTGTLATNIFHPGRISRVWATGTTATGFLGQY